MYFSSAEDEVKKLFSLDFGDGVCTELDVNKSYVITIKLSNLDLVHSLIFMKHGIYVL